MADKDINANNNPIVSVLSLKDISYIPNRNIKYETKNKKNKNISFKREDPKTNDRKGSKEKEKINLISSLKNSLINKDDETLLWCLEQKDDNIIESTAKRMDISIIKIFIEKSIDLFQTNNLRKKNIHKWLKYIIDYKKIEILSSKDKELMRNLNTLQSLIENYTKHLEILFSLDKKFNIALKGIKNRKEDGTNEIPLINYIESDEEEEIQRNIKLKEKMKEKGFKTKE
ncbi:MAG: hypothetical protein MJ252_15415, partial [archaeon]|nr:hypothetical protein [archaeon]